MMMKPFLMRLSNGGQGGLSLLLNFAMRTELFAAALGLLLSASSGAAFASSSPAPGEWTLSGAGERVSLHANEASLGEVLEGLRDLSGARLRFGPVADRNVSLRIANVPLPELLRLLDVSYLLTYVDDGEGAHRLDGAWVSFFEAVALPSPAVRADLAEAVWGDGPRPFAAHRVLREGTPDGRPGPPLISGVEYRAAMPVQVMVDGNLDDWPEWVPWQDVEGGLVDQVGDGNPDTSFSVAAVADEQSLFFGVRVRDDQRASDNVDELRFQADDQLRFALQVLNPDGTLADPTIITMRRHHVFMRDAQDASRLVPGTRQVVRNSQGVSAVIVSDNEGWFVEMGVPFDRLGIDASEGPPLFSFDLVLEDHDKDTDSVRQLAWRRSDRLGGTEASDEGLLRVIDMRTVLP